MKHQDNFMNNWLIFIELATYLITADSITLFEGTNHIFHLWKKPPEKNCLLQKWSKLATKKVTQFKESQYLEKVIFSKERAKRLKIRKSKISRKYTCPLTHSICAKGFQIITNSKCIRVPFQTIWSKIYSMIFLAKNERFN